MKINDIILEAGMSPDQQKEAQAVYTALVSSNDPYLNRVAYYFASTRNEIRHRTVDSAQQSAEAMVRREVAKNAMSGKSDKELNDAFEKNTGVSISLLVRDRMEKKKADGTGRGQYTKYKDGTDRKSSTSSKSLKQQIKDKWKDFQDADSIGGKSVGKGKFIAKQLGDMGKGIASMGDKFRNPPSNR